jgi:hypothetical protein
MIVWFLLFHTIAWPLLAQFQKVNCTDPNYRRSCPSSIVLGKLLVDIVCPSLDILGTTGGPDNSHVHIQISSALEVNHSESLRCEYVRRCTRTFRLCGPPEELLDDS